MRQETKTNLHRIMDASVNAFEKAMTALDRIHADKDKTAEAKARDSYKAADELTEALAANQKELRDLMQELLSGVNAARISNANHMDDHAYQTRVLQEAALFRHLPETMSQESLERRIVPFYADTEARELLLPSLLECSETRKMGGVLGFDVDALFPDVYDLQEKMVDKIRAAIESALQRMGNNLLTGGDRFSTEANERTALFAKGILEGVGVYVDKLPEEFYRIDCDGIKRVYHIPAYALSKDALGIYFAMYRD